MKKSNVRAIEAAEESGFDTAAKSLENAILAEAPVTRRDKKGSKISDAEIEKMPFIAQHISKFENNLRRNFDEAEFFKKGASIEAKKAQIKELERLTAILTNQVTVERIDLKALFIEVYDAAKKAAEKDVTLEFIKNSLAECYERNNSKNEENADNSASEPSKQG
ncbi:MAG: hypothetical protein JNL70_00065 [Saprospiraceae bacterium]|nr:hypothetical protein [Saprospiraceae bacterium]